MNGSGQDPRTDEELIRDLRSGDGDAEEQLYERYKMPVRRRARAYFLMGADRDDVIQEGMIGLYKAVCEYVPERGVPFRAYADLCVTRQILTAVKAAAGKKHHPLNNYVSLSAPVNPEMPDHALIDLIAAAQTSDPEVIVIDRDSCERLQRKLSECLTPLEKQVLSMYLDGFPYKRIAEVTGHSAKSVDNALQRVKKKTEKCLNEERA
ncbi:MAG: RNA polymerase sporulation sigma factor SigH [Clostridia bacterium]|nr:RNA polymerase sporulation sigma factor SigH [Clostridia bacterium]